MPEESVFRSSVAVVTARGWAQFRTSIAASGHRPVHVREPDAAPCGSGCWRGGAERFAHEVDFTRRAHPGFSGQDRAQAVSGFYELADRIEAYQSASDPAARDVLRDRVLRQARAALGELLGDDEATGQLEEAARTLPEPAVRYADPET